MVAMVRTFLNELLRHQTREAMRITETARRFSTSNSPMLSRVAIATVKSGVGLDPVLNDRVGFLRGLPEKTV
jgi:hypothetical protein